jgi:hypothetical protein
MKTIKRMATEEEQQKLFDVSLAVLAERKTEVREQLVIAQLREWPDSTIYTANEAMTRWLPPAPFTPFAQWKEDPYNRLLNDTEVELRESYERDLLRHQATHYRQLAGCFGCLLANGCEAVFYECGEPDEQGRRFRGARVGVEGSEYSSGFPGGRF